MGQVLLKPEESEEYGVKSFKVPIPIKKIRKKLKPLTKLSLIKLREWYHKFKIASKGTHDI